MRIPRPILLILWATMLGLLVNACAGSTPVTLEEIPVYGGAQPVEPGANYITDAMMKAIQQSITNQELTAEIRVYRLPDGTEWESVKQFYADETGDNWKSAPDLTQGADVINIIGWQRGGSSDQQVLIVGQAQDPLSGESYLLTGLFSK